MLTVHYEISLADSGLRMVAGSVVAFDATMPLHPIPSILDRLLSLIDRSLSTTHPNQPLQIDKGFDNLLSSFYHFNY